MKRVHKSKSERAAGNRSGRRRRAAEQMAVNPTQESRRILSGRTRNVAAGAKLIKRTGGTQFHPDNFCDPASAKYRDKYAGISRRPTHVELDRSWRRAKKLGLKFETTTFERRKAFGMPAMLEF